MKKIGNTLLALIAINSGLYAQNDQKRTLTIEELFTLTQQNHPNLKVLQTDVVIAGQNVAMAKNARLPNLNLGIQGYYLGDALIIDKDFSASSRVDMPHFGNTFSVDATQLVWKGGTVKNEIKEQLLHEELSKLNYQSNEQNIKLLVLGYYLDLYKVVNQENVYLQNIQLAKQRLANINKFHAQGMVTRNDVIRGELQLSNLQLALQVVENNYQILNKELTTALGLPESINIMPDGSLLNNIPSALQIADYKVLAEDHPAFQMAKKVIDIQETSEKITKAEIIPSLSLFAGNKLARPITTSSPAIDMYTNGWSAGLSLNFSVDALYKSPQKIKKAHFEIDRAIAKADEMQQMIEVAVNTAYIKYDEAITQNKTLKTNKELAEENYRIMNSKYNNQLAILLDLIDASNQKLDAELQFSNSAINIIYAYYKLLKASGYL